MGGRWVAACISADTREAELRWPPPLPRKPSSAECSDDLERLMAAGVVPDSSPRLSDASWPPTNTAALAHSRAAGTQQHEWPTTERSAPRSKR
jgi:hypothetical protein